MYKVVVFILTGMFLCSSTVVRGQQAAAVPLQKENRATPIMVEDCGNLFDAALLAQRTLERDRRVFAETPDSSPSEMNGAGSRYADLQQDLAILKQEEARLNQCKLANSGSGTAQNPFDRCSTEQLLNFQMNHEGEVEREIPIWHLPGNTAFFYEAGMTIDADGAPNAYHPDNTGLDDLANAGAPGSWEGLAKNGDGEPFVQGPNDPFPGYYVSATALADRSKPANDPMRYVDASRIPYIVLPGGMARQMGARPGDFSIVLNLRNGKSSYAIFGDVGPFDRIGEGSMALAENLGIRSDARNGGARRGILYLVFPGSGDGRPRTIEEINSEAEKWFQAWGGSIQLTACTIQQPARPFEGSRSTN